MDKNNWEWHARIARGKALTWFKSIYTWPPGCKDIDFWSSDFTKKMNADHFTVMDTSDEEQATDAEDQSTRDALYYLAKGQRRFVLDSGASSHIISRCTLTEAEKASIHRVDTPGHFNTANAPITCWEMVWVEIPKLGISLHFYVGEGQHLPLIAINKMCREHGFINTIDGSDRSCLTRKEDGKSSMFK